MLAGDPDDAQDFEGEPRIQRSATDVERTSYRPIGPAYPHFVPVGNFATPMYITGPPNDPHRVFVVQRGGTIRIIKDGTVEPTPFLDISSLVTTVGEGGLLSMAFAPDYATSRHFYVYYAGVPDSGDGGLQGDIHVAEFQAKANNPDQADPSSRRELLHIDHSERPNHYAGQLQTSPDGMLWISTGDGDFDSNLAQDRTSLLGKLLRIDPHPDGGLPVHIPADNPYANCGCSFRPEIWAYGLRNPCRWSFDCATGDIIIADVGRSDFDEIDYVPAGHPGGMNFGWPITEGDMLVATRQRVTPATAPPNYLGPITVRRQLDNDTATIGGFVVRDPNLGPLVGRYVYVDYFKGQLRSARLSVGGTIDDKEIAGLDAHQDEDAFGQDQCGRLYVIQMAVRFSPDRDRAVDDGSGGARRRLRAAPDSVAVGEGCVAARRRDHDVRRARPVERSGDRLPLSVGPVRRRRHEQLQQGHAVSHRRRQLHADRRRRGSHVPCPRDRH